MIKLVNFLKINFILIFVCFFLPFFPFFSCESSEKKGSSADSTVTVVESIYIDTLSVSKPQISSSVLDTLLIGTDSLAKKQHLLASQKHTGKIIDFLSFTMFKTSESNVSITGFGCIVLFFESIFSGEFDFLDWGDYLIPISFIACLSGLLGSIKSRRRKHQFLFVCSLSGLGAISIIGFSVGNLSDLLFGFWMVAVLYLINSLLSFILWKNYFPFKVSNE